MRYHPSYIFDCRYEGDMTLVHAQQPKSGLSTFAIAMIASLISLTGTQMTQFAVITWAWNTTGSTATTGLITVAIFATIVVVSVFAGALVDRWNRKLVIIITDAIGLLSSAMILFLYLTSNLQVWHLALLGIILGILESFQFPAYLASITEMVTEEQRGRANAMFQLSWSISSIVSLSLAGILFATIGISGILIVDIGTFIVIMTTISFSHIPQPDRTSVQSHSLMKEIVEGFQYILARPALLGTVLVFASINIAYGAYQGLIRPMILAFTANNALILGQALAAVAVGSVVGGILMSIWHGPKNKVPMMLIAWALTSFCEYVLIGLGRSLLFWLIVGFLQGIFSTIARTLIFTIWQANVASSIQGRIFGIIRLIVQVSIPISVLITTQLADHLIEPAMHPGKPLSHIFGGLLGTSDGSGMSLVLITMGIIFGIAFPLAGFLVPAIRKADQKTVEVVVPEVPAVVE